MNEYPGPDSFIKKFENIHTVDAYRRTIKTFQKFLAGRQPTLDLAKEWIASMHNVSVATQNVHISCLRGYLRSLNIEGDIPILSYRAPRQTVMPWDKRQALIDSTKTLRDRALLTTLVYSGLRWEGLHNLRWQGVHEQEKELETIEKRGIRRTRDSKLGPVLVNQKVIEALIAYRSRKAQPDDHVFPFSYRTALRALQAAAKRAGIPCQTLDQWGIKGLHSVRRSNATHQYSKLKAGNVDEMMQGLDHIRKMLSHSNPLTTIQYLYIDKEKSREMYDRLIGDDD